LLTPLFEILLIDTNGVNPKDPRLIFVSEIWQGFCEILRNGKCLSTRFPDEDFGKIFGRAPGIRDCLELRDVELCERRDVEAKSNF
jgi:hypothetical protein